MLSARRKSDGKTVLAHFESKSNEDFACLDCGDPVILKAGKNRVHHFAHENPIACTYTKGESDCHRHCKMELYTALKREPGVQDVTLERSLGAVRPDVSANIRGVPVAIEVQISHLSLETILNRTIWYARKGIYVLWLVPWTSALENSQYSPKRWERWIHAAYFGRVYYWVNGATVVSYHFEPSLKSVRKRSWFTRNGKRMTAGGYTKRSKRHFTPVRGRSFHLVGDFAPQERLWWRGHGVTVPDAKLFMEPRRVRSLSGFSEER